MPRYLGYSLLILSVSQFLHSEIILHETNFLLSKITYTDLNNRYLTGKAVSLKYVNLQFLIIITIIST
jgi:hypothetical protein